MKLLLYAFVLGALGIGGFAPLHVSILTPLSAYGLMRLTEHTSRPFLIGMFYELGYFGLGGSWVYTIIHLYSDISDWLGFLLTILFALTFVPFYGGVTWAYRRLFPMPSTPHRVFGFASLWVLSEFMRGQWFWIGFPCFLTGYTAINTFWDSWAPVGSVYGVGWMMLAMTFLTAELLSRRMSRMNRLGGLAFLLALIGGTYFLNKIPWTKPQSDRLYQVSLIQGNIPQQVKWTPQWVKPSLGTYAHHTASEKGADLVLWPETALPILPGQVSDYLKDLDDWGKEQGSSIIIGTPTLDKKQHTQNSLQLYGTGSPQQYNKRRLVPFGEYNPFGRLSHWLVPYFNIPLSSLEIGTAEQPPFHVNGMMIQPFICYEIVYPDLVAQTSPEIGVILNASNDTWFGPSWGQAQQMQIAQMRAKELGRYVLRVTNNGITGIVNEKGEITKKAPVGQVAVLRGTFESRTGQTLVQRFGIYPTFWWCIGVLLVLTGISAWRRAPQSA